MEINITKYVNYPPNQPIYGSMANLGTDAATMTFNNAKEYASGCDLLDTPEKVAAFKKHIDGYGAWDKDEVESWSHDELVALLCQCIEADIQDFGPIDESRDTNPDEGGYCFRGSDGEYYFLAE